MLNDESGASTPWRSETADGMRIDWDVPIRTEDGTVLRADVFRPPGAVESPVILSYGPYAKGLGFEDGYPSAWQMMVDHHPTALAGSSNKYQNWEVVDPEKWVPRGYACVRVDSRGSGRSPGYLSCFSEQETQDFKDCIDWAGTQSWSNGKVGLSGISYYAANQWMVAGAKPPHLAAICVWEGFADFYRDASHHGGIPTSFWANWYDMQVKSVQHGLGEAGGRSRITGQLICGDITLDEHELEERRDDFGASIAEHGFDDAYHVARSASWSDIVVPLLTCGNWGGQGLHLRGNVEGFVQAAGPMKWLEMHGHAHWPLFYTDYGVHLQMQFFDHFLKGEDNGWLNRPPVVLNVRHVDETFILRAESSWPLERTQWTHLYLAASELALRHEAPVERTLRSFDVAGDGLDFITAPLPQDVELTGPLAARLFVESTQVDADLFLVVRVLAPDGGEVVFQGALDPHTPIAQGWLRASHRALDEKLSQPYRPYHSHTSTEPLKPGRTYALDIEILPTCLVIPAGYRIQLTVRGKDYVYPGEAAALSNLKNRLTGCGPFLHEVGPEGLDASIESRVTVHTGGATASYLLLPLIYEGDPVISWVSP